MPSGQALGDGVQRGHQPVGPEHALLLLPQHLVRRRLRAGGGSVGVWLWLLSNMVCVVDETEDQCGLRELKRERSSEIFFWFRSTMGNECCVMAKGVRLTHWESENLE